MPNGKKWNELKEWRKSGNNIEILGKERKFESWCQMIKSICTGTYSGGRSAQIFELSTS